MKVAAAVSGQWLVIVEEEEHSCIWMEEPWLGQFNVIVKFLVLWLICIRVQVKALSYLYLSWK